jgi:spermidine synthase
MTPKYHLERNSELIDMSGSELFLAHDQGHEITVHYKEGYGNVLFIDGEVQISSRDYEVYHQAMLAMVPLSYCQFPAILVVGDGDGGFTNRSEFDITQVEMSDVVRHAATLAFGVSWTPTSRYRLFSGTLRQYLDSTPTSKYDAVFLAITDEFNSNPENFRDVREACELIRPGGVLVAQVGCQRDPNFNDYLKNYVNLAESLGLTPCGDSLPWIPCFHSAHLFRAFTKV